MNKSIYDRAFDYRVGRDERLSVTRREIENLMEQVRCPGTYSAPPAPAPLPVTSADLLKRAEVLAEQEEVAAEAAALQARIQYDIDLADATLALLHDIRSFAIKGGGTVGAKTSHARFRKELAPLAAAYGVKFAIVGDRTTATLSK